MTSLTTVLRNKTLNASCCALMAWLLAISASARAQDEIQKGERKMPKDSEVYALVGQPMSKVFATFQEPQNMTAADVDTKTPSVCFDYGPFGYIVRDKAVRTCIFWYNWKDTVCGVHLGDTSEAVIQKLGKPSAITVEVAGPQHLLWNITDKDRDLQLMLDFDKEKKLDRAVVRPSK